MNKIYKVVWNTVRNCYVVGSELISSKSGRHSASNGKSSSLKVTLTVLALCGMTALGSGVAPAYAADAGATTDMNQYVALKYDNSNNQNEQVEQTNGKRQTVTTFNGKRYIKVDSGVSDNTGRPIYYWVREGYSLTMVDGQPYTSLSSNGRRADVSWTGDANAKPSDILESVTSTHVQTNVTTNVGETLQQVNAGTYAGVTNSGGTEVDGDWDYIVNDPSWKGVVNASNYRNGYANLISNGKPKGFVSTTDAGSKLAWNANLNAYTYDGKVVDYSNIYVIDGEIGVFTNASGSEVYTGTVFGKNNEVLMTVKKSDGKYYSYWGAKVNDAGATMDTYRVAEYQNDLNVLRDNDFALYHNDIKSVDMSTDASSATISLMRNGDGTSSPAVDGTLTITNGGGADGKDTYVRISNTTNGKEVSKTFTTGSKVEALGTQKAITALKINGETYNITTAEVNGGTNIASVDKTTGSNGNDVYTVNAKGTTVSTDDNFVLDITAAENNVTNYGLSLANSITIGKGESSHPIVIDGNKGEITGLTNKTLDAADFATVGRAATEEQLKEVNSKATAAKTTVTQGKNIAVNGKSDENGSTYTVALADDVSLGNNAIQLNGSDGSISATSGTSSLNFNDKGLSLSNGKNSTVINGGTITVNGGESVISGTQATFGKIKLNAESGSTITGLSNTTTKYEGFATSGRAATEEQLKEVSGQASDAIETAGKGWNLTTNKGTATNIKPDGTVDFSSSNDNLVISNAGANLSFSLSDNLDLTNNKDKKGSVKVGENTALSNELLQVGKDVSLTASALNVGTSSLTTSALMVGGLTYISPSGINANGRVISNVAAGSADTDAVNVGQLKSAISGSKVSIKAGDGIIVEKTGNQYTIKTNIKGGSTSTGTVTVTTEDNTSTSSGGSSKLPLRQMAIMETAEMAAAEATTTDAGKAITIANTDFDLKFKTDAGTTATVNNGGTVNISGDDVNVSTSSKAGTNSDTIRIALNKDIKVDSITAKTDGGQLNIKSEVNMNSQKITNLAEGDISETSTDAVTGSQLYNTNQAVIANAENINSLSHSLNKLDSRINRVGAGAAALAALHPLDFDPDNKWDFAAGYGNYAGANAVAIGTYYRPNENTMFSIGGSFGGGENMINAGVSFKLGSGGSGITTSKTVMAKKIKEQDELLKAQDAKMKEQDEKIAKLEALVAQQGEMIQQALGKK